MGGTGEPRDKKSGSNSSHSLYKVKSKNSILEGRAIKKNH